jgi:hypothetical protein
LTLMENIFIIWTRSKLELMTCRRSISGLPEVELSHMKAPGFLKTHFIQWKQYVIVLWRTRSLSYSHSWRNQRLIGTLAALLARRKTLWTTDRPVSRRMNYPWSSFEKISVLAIQAERFDLVICPLPWLLLKHAVFVESYSHSQRTRLLSFGFVILLLHFHRLNKQKRCQIAHDHGKQIGMNYQSNLRGEQLLKSLGLFFHKEQEIARNELLNLGSLATNQEEQIFPISQESGSWRR